MIKTDNEGCPDLQNLLTPIMLTPESIFVAIKNPIMLPIKWENIPTHLKNIPDFFLWKYHLNGNNWTKKPTTEWSKPENRATLEEIKKIWDQLPNKDEVGLAFAFTTTNDVIGIDIDGCFTEAELPDDSAITTSVNDLIKNLNCYTEISPSKKGLHLIARVKNKELCPVPITNLKYPECDHIEYYKSGRWFAFTGYFHKELPKDIPFIDENKLIDLVGDKLQKEPFKLPNIIETGNRDNTLFRMACSMRTKGMSEQSILAAVREENILRCKPPLQENDIVRIAGQAAKYDPSSPIMLYKPEIVEITEEELENSKIDETTPFVFGLENNFINDWISYHKKLSDAFIDYHHATALTALSIIINRKAVFELKQVRVYPNIWAFIIGQSTIGRKSTIFGQLHEFDYLFKQGTRCELPKQFSPEAFVELLDRNSKSYYLNDECADLLKSINKKAYMADLRDLFCQLYDNINISRSLRTKRNKQEKSDFKVVDPYLPMLFATVPSNLERFCEYDDLSSGWMIRFLYYFPKYEKEFMALTQKNDDDLIQKTKITTRLAEINSFFVSLDREIKFFFEDDASKFFEAWNKKTDMANAKRNDDIVQSAIGRLEVYAFKLAMIFEISNNDFIEKFQSLNNTKDEFKFGLSYNYPVSLASIKEACREVDEYFIPMIERVKVLIESADNRNHQQKIINIIKRVGGKITKGDLCKLVRLGKKDLDDALYMLEKESEEIEIKIMKGKTKDIQYIFIKNP